MNVWLKEWGIKMHTEFRGERFWLCDQGCMWHECKEHGDSELVGFETRGTAACQRCGAKITNRAGDIWKLWALAQDFFHFLAEWNDDFFVEDDDYRDPFESLVDEEIWGEFFIGPMWNALYEKAMQVTNSEVTGA